MFYKPIPSLFRADVREIAHYRLIMRTIRYAYCIFMIYSSANYAYARTSETRLKTSSVLDAEAEAMWPTG